MGIFQALFLLVSSVALVSCLESSEHANSSEKQHHGVSLSKEESNPNKFKKVTNHSSGLFLTPEQEQCVATYPTLKAENIRAGVTIGGITGTATEYPTCSATVITNCISTAEFPAVNTVGLAAKILTGQTVAGVAGTAIEAKPECTAANQTDCIATTTYRTMDLSNKDAGGALDLTNSNFETRVASASTFEYWDETGARHTNTGDADLVASNIDTGVTIFGTAGTAVAPDCSSISGSGTWILVPGDPDYGTNDFCVMKYEAKNNSGVPTSTAADTPWVSIDQQDSKTECASLGAGYHLITNDEWMTIATNVAAQGANWDGGTVGTNEMTRGHSDNNPTNACAADASDANAYVETDCTGSPSGTFNQRRTHTLSNGEVIWDLSGNVWEWTSYFNDSDKPYDATDGNPVASWREYTLIDTFGTMSQTDLISQAAVTGGWSSTEAIGQYNAQVNGSGGALRRGGYWNDTTNAGVFAAILSSSPTNTDSRIGFRCAVAVP